MKIAQEIVTLLSVACIAGCGLVLVLVAHDANGFLLLFLAIAMSAAMAVIQRAAAGEPGQADPYRTLQGRPWSGLPPRRRRRRWWARKRGWSYAADNRSDPKRKP